MFNPSSPRHALLYVVAAAMTVALVIPATGVRADVGLAVEGFDRARLLPPAGADTEAYEGVGYALLLDPSGEVQIEVDVSPLGSRSRFEAPSLDDVDRQDPVLRLSRSITSGVGTTYEASSRLLGWVSRQIAYELDREAPQDAFAVLERRSGYCTGVARLTVAMHRAVGIEAREVAGYVVGDGDAGPQGFHRWVEVHLPDIGWVMSDPLVSHHYVPATYLRLSSEQVAPSIGMDGLLVERRSTLAPVDLYPSAPPGVRGRRNDGNRLYAALRVAVDTGGTGLAVLEGKALRFRRSLVDGETTFVGLEPGEYRLQLFLAGRGLVERRLELVGRQRTTLYLDADHRPKSHPADPHGNESRGIVTTSPGDRSEE